MPSTLACSLSRASRQYHGGVEQAQHAINGPLPWRSGAPKYLVSRAEAVAGRASLKPPSPRGLDRHLPGNGVTARRRGQEHDRASLIAATREILLRAVAVERALDHARTLRVARSRVPSVRPESTTTISSQNAKRTRAGDAVGFVQRDAGRLEPERNEAGIVQSVTEESRACRKIDGPQHSSCAARHTKACHPLRRLQVCRAAGGRGGAGFPAGTGGESGLYSG